MKFSYHIHKQFSWDELVDVDLEPTRVKVDHGYMCGKKKVLKHDLTSGGSRSAGVAESSCRGDSRR